MKTFHNKIVRCCLVLAALISCLDGVTVRAQIITANSPMAVARLAHTATVLLNGKILVVGGIGLTSTTNSAELYDPATGSWTNTGFLNIARNQHTATLLLNGKVLVAGGSAASGMTNSAELYDPVTGTWTVTGSMTTGRNQHTATLLPSGKVLVVAGTGNGNAFLSSVELYDPAAGTWSVVNPVSTARSSHTATLLTNGMVLVAGGNAPGPSYVNACELYNPSNGTWTTTGAMINSRFRHSATLLPNGRVLVASGGNASWNSLCEIYYPTTGGWSNAPAMNFVHADGSATLLPNGKVLIAGGYNGATGGNGVELFDYAVTNWTTTTSLVTARYYQTQVLLANGKVMIAGGNSGSATASTELFEITNATWSVTNSLNTSRSAHTATMLTNGKILVAGGQNGGVATNSAELFDTTTGAWTTTGPMTNSRAFHTATLLVNGKVLVTGGQSTGGIITNGAELFDSTLGTWTSTSPLKTARHSHTATVLTDGRVLAVGGQTISGTTNGAELYDPTSGTWTNTGALGTGRKNHTATLLPNSKILVVGGTNNLTGNILGAELFDPSAGTWSPTSAPLTARQLHTATLLPNGKVLIAGGLGNNPTNGAELYNPVSGTWANTGPMITARFAHTATLLPNGKVLVTGGTNNAGNVLSSELYDPAFGTWASTRTLNAARNSHSATLLIDGKILITGGQTTTGTTNGVELYDVGQGFTNSWRPVITNFPAFISMGSTLTVGGSQFRGLSEASGGNMQDSSSDFPIVQLRNLESGQILFPLSTNWNTNTFTTVTVTNFPTGYALMTVFANAIPSASAIVAITKPVATVTLNNLTATYDASAKTVTATTSPVGLTVNITYNGSTNAPTNAGSYTVVGTVNDLTYQGGATNTLVISKAAGNIVIFNTSQTYDGSAKNVSVITSPNTFPYSLTYNGSVSAPTNAGSYTVIGIINDTNYAGSATNTLVVSKTNGVVTLGNLAQVYNGTARSVTATTVPPGLTVDITYGLSPNAPTNAGSYGVTATINDTNYQGSANDSLVISKATAGITVGNLLQTYDGSTKSATVTTAPTNLNVFVTYDGIPVGPVNAGSYINIVTVSDSNYQGAATNTFVIAKATAIVTLANLAQTYDNTAKIVTATTSPTNLPVIITYNGSVTPPTNAGNYTVIGTINHTNYQGSVTNTLAAAKIPGTVNLSSLNQTYNGTARVATATTSPGGMTVDFTYNGSAIAPTNAGSYTVIGILNNVNYFGGATNTLLVAQASAGVTLTNLVQTYDGTGKNVGATTSPGGLAVNFTYNGSANAPTNAGSYTVIGTASDVNYFGGATNTLVINKAVAAVTLGALAQTYDSLAKNVSVTTAPTNLTVLVTYNGSLNGPTNAGSYTVIGTINEANYLGSATNALVVAPAVASVTLGNLAQIYDGFAKPVFVTTAPTNLTVIVTYNGSTNAPTNAASYTVIGTISEPNYVGSSTNTLLISKATATISFGNLSQTYDGTARIVTATTTPPGLTVLFTYNGSAAAPTNAGSYTVVGTVSDANYLGSNTNTLVVAQALASVTLTNLSQVYNGTARSVGATTAPGGLIVNFTYNGLPNAPTNAASYTVIGTISDVNYFGGATNTLVITKATATILFGSLTQMYDGTARIATATTAPSGLTVNFTYNASSAAPTNAGSYTVIGNISDANYLGSNTNTLVVAQALASVTLTNLSQVYNGIARSVGATTAPGGLIVNFTYNGSPNAPTNAASYTVIGTVSDVNYFGSATNMLVIGKATATVSLANLSQIYDGFAKSVSVTTAPTNLAVVVTYDGSPVAPTNAATYTVVGTVSDLNYQGSSTNALVITKAAASVSLANLSHIYDGFAKTATATTVPGALTVNFNYNGSANSPTNAGSYTVIGTINDVNYSGSATNTLVISKGTATVNLLGLAQVYDGFAKTATATTLPGGLIVNFTYNGSANALTNAGSYTVIGTVSDVNYSGSATNTLIISKAGAGVNLTGLNQIFNGSARVATATTTPSGLTVNFTYNGLANAPTNAGSYTVIGTISDGNYFGGATNTLVVSKAAGTINFLGLAQIYTGTARFVTATTSPGGLTVNLTYDGAVDAPTNVGSYSVIGSISDVNYLGSNTNTLVVSKATATVTLGNLSQIYDGNAKNVSVTTAPTNLTVIVTYDGSTSAPTNVGGYTVIGTVSDANYQGSATNTLVIGCPVITVSPSSLPAANLNVFYSQTITASGGSLLPYNFMRTAGSLPSGITLSTNGTLSGTPTSGGNFNFTVTATDANGCSGARSYILAVVVPPSISTPPASQIILPGGTATLTVTAGGTGPLSYQWQLNGTNIFGATDSTLTLTNVSAADAGHYTVVVSNAGGAVTSAYALVTVWTMNFYPVVTVNGHVGDQYRVDYTEDLDATNWFVLGYVTLPSSVYYMVDTNSPGSNRRFYRVVAP